jgi:hypothetical protein
LCEVQTTIFQKNNQKMKKLLFLSTLALTLCGAAFAQNAPGTVSTYGTSFTTQDAILSPGRLPMVMKEKQSLENFKMTGTIAEVCQKEGCWMLLRTQPNIDDDVLIKVKDHAFVLPKNIAGKRASVTGNVVKKTQSVAEQQHLLEDAGASAAEIAKITSPKEIYEMQATGVVLYH